MSWLTDRLSALMAERALTADAVARQLAIERSRLAKIISGAALPNETLTRRMARLFDQNPEEWLANVEARADRRAAPPSSSTAFTKVARQAEVPEGQMKIVCNGLAVVTRVAGQLHAFGNTCPHAAAALGEGLLKGCIVKCPWHAGRWDVTTGQALTLLETTPIPIFDVRIEGDDIEIRLDERAVSVTAAAG